MYIRKNKSRGKTYYQIVNERINPETKKKELTMVAHLGTISKILAVFSFFKDYKKTDSKVIQLGNGNGIEKEVKENLTELKDD